MNFCDTQTRFKFVGPGLSLIMAATAFLGNACLSRRVGETPTAHYAIDVEFVPQQSTNDCGTAALVMLMQFHGGDPDDDQLRRDLTIPALGGTIPALLVAEAVSAGYDAVLRQGDPNAVRTALKAGIPVIALLAATDGSPVGHFVVVTGITENGDQVRIHDGPHRNRWMAMDTFVPRWSQTDYLTIALSSQPYRAVPSP